MGGLVRLVWAAVFFAMVLLAGCGKREPQYRREVNAYIEALAEGTYKSQMEMKLFEPQAIPVLLDYADDERAIPFPPVNPLSSYIVSSCSVGMFALWTIEGIRLAQDGSDDKKSFMGYPSLVPLLWDQERERRPEFGEDGYEEIQKRAAAAYRNWWNSGSFSQIKLQDPLDGTRLHW
jgi:hypothetical protein